MIRKIRYLAVFIGILVGGLSCSQAYSTPQNKWRILIVAESDKLGLRAGHPAYKRVNNAIFTQLERAGFDVLSLAGDKTLPLCLMDVCEQQTEQDIIALANASASSIDLVILFSVRYIERLGAGTIHREISVPSRMIDVKSGRRVGLWDDDGVLTEPIPAECVDRCLQSALSDYARQIGRDSGLAIAIKLQEYQRWFNYKLTFLKFAKGELFAFERYFQNSFKSHFVRAGSNGIGSSTEENTNTHQVLLHTVVNKTMVVESLLPPLGFRQSLERILDDEILRANIQTNGHEFTLNREGVPYLWRYIFTVILFVVFVVASYFRFVRYQYHDVLSRLESMTLTDNNPYPLLKKVERLLGRLNGDRVQQKRNKVTSARDAFIEKLPVLTGRGTLMSEGLPITVNVLVEDNVRIGRCENESVKRSEAKGNDGNIVIGFTRLSHIGKQIKIERHLDGFTLVDEGSSNGSFLDGVSTVSDHPVSLSGSEHMLCLGGSRIPLKSGMCKLRLHAKNAKANSLFIEVDSDAVALADPVLLNKHWPNLAYDQTQQWLLLGTMLDLGVDANGKLDIGCLRGSKPLARLSYFPSADGMLHSCPGYWLDPIVDVGKPVGVRINQTLLCSAAPLVRGAKVSMGGVYFTLTTH